MGAMSTSLQNKLGVLMASRIDQIWFAVTLSSQQRPLTHVLAVLVGFRVLDELDSQLG